MKLLVVDHNALEPANRVLYEKIVSLGGIELRLVVPSKWFNNFSELRFTPPPEKLTYELVSSDVLFSSRTHRLIYVSLAKHLHQFKPDVFYMNAEPENFQTFQAALLSPFAAAKLVFSSWRNIDHAAKGFPYKLEFVHRKIEKYVLSKAAHGIMFTQTAGHIFERIGFPATTFIPPHVDTSVFQPRFRGERNTNLFTIGFVGRLVEPKGCDLILHALKELPANCTALVVGNGPLKDSLKRLCEELKIMRRVRFLDAVRPMHLPNILSQMDVVVLPSKTTVHWKEQFGRVLIEAMACGVPVIGSTSGEISNVIGNAGLVFKEGSAEGLRLGIERLRTNELFGNELREAGIRRVRRLFSIEVVAKQYHDLLLSV